MRSKKLIVIIVVILILVVLFLFVRRAKQRLAKAPIYKPRPIPVEVKRAKIEEVVLTKHYLANIKSDLQALIYPKITQQIVEVLKDEGDFVKKGELMAILDDREIQAKIQDLCAQIKALEEKVNATKSELLGAKSEYEFFLAEYKRAKNLLKTKAISRSFFDKAKAKYESSYHKVVALRKTIDSLKYSIKALKSQLKKEKVYLSYTRIRAPFDGVVEIRYKDKGNMAQINSPLFKISSYKRAKLVFSIVQEDIGIIKKGMDVYVRWPVEYKKIKLPYKLKITKIFPSLIDGKTTYVECYIGDLPLGIKMESFVPVDVVVARLKGVVVPSFAIVPLKQGYGIYVVKNKHLELKKVNVKLKTPLKAVVEGEVKPSDMVVVGDYLKWIKLAPGMKVVISQ